MIQEDKPEKSQFSPKEEKALEDFFKALNVAFKNASMYFREHPSFVKISEELKVKLENMRVFRKVLDIGITSQDLLLDRKYIKKGKPPYKDVAQYLHKRRIKKLTINTEIGSQALGDFVFKAAYLIKDVLEGKSISECMGDIKGMAIEELDYSSLIGTSGKHPQDIWKVLLNKGQPSEILNSKVLQYYAENIESIIDEIKHKPLDKGMQEVFFNNLQNISKSLQDSNPNDTQKLAKGIARPLFDAPAELLNTFLEKDKFTGLKEFLSKNLDKDVVFEDCFQSLVSSKQFNPLFLNFYNIVIEEIKDEGKLADEMSSFFGKKQSSQEKERIIEPLRELFFRDPSNKFISSLYKKTLSYLSEYVSVSSQEAKIIEDYKKDLNKDIIDIDYFYILLELLRIEDNISDLALIFSKIEKEIPFFLERKNIEIIKDLLTLLDEKLASCSDVKTRKILKDFYEKTYHSGLLEYILENIKEFDNLQSIKVILPNINDYADSIVAALFSSKDLEVHKKLKEILISLADRKVFVALRKFLKTQDSSFVLREAIDVLSHINIEDSLHFLQELYEDNKDNKVISYDLLRAIRSSPFKNKEFIKSFVTHKDYNLRKDMVGSYLGLASAAEKVDIINKLTNVSNFLGFKDQLIIENIDILSKHHMEELIPLLVKFVTARPLLFRKRRDRVRIRSLQALIEMESKDLKFIKQSLLKDPNKKIRELALKLK